MVMYCNVAFYGKNTVGFMRRGIAGMVVCASCLVVAVPRDGRTRHHGDDVIVHRLHFTLLRRGAGGFIATPSSG